MTPLRAKYIDPDFRNQADGDYCVVCGRAIRRAQKPLSPEQDALDDGEGKMGIDCARKLGLEWSRAP